MIILSPYHPKILPPVPMQQWREPSAAIARDQMGNKSVETRFRLSSVLDDGFRRWTGWFDSRDDLDAFLYAIAVGTINARPELWRLPSPEWVPGLEEGAILEFATVTFYTSPTGSNQTWTRPADWNNANNTIEILGAGGSGAARNGSVEHAVGGGGGQYRKATNFTASASHTYQLGAGGAAVSPGSSTSSNGNAGGNTWFDGTTFAGATLSAQGGSGGVSGAGSQTGGAGGSTGTGGTGNNGGAGGNLTGASGGGGSGGGGAGGAAGAGNAGVSASTTGTFDATNGGSGDAGSGGSAGTAGTATGGAGGNGTEWDASHGSGGGGGGAARTGSSTGGSGGNYGGGGGGVRGNSVPVTSGAGIQGLMVVTYTPALLFPGNLAMIGM